MESSISNKVNGSTSNNKNSKTGVDLEPPVQHYNNNNNNNTRSIRSKKKLDNDTNLDKLTGVSPSQPKTLKSLTSRLPVPYVRKTTIPAQATPAPKPLPIIKMSIIKPRSKKDVDLKIPKPEFSKLYQQPKISTQMVKTNLKTNVTNPNESKSSNKKLSVHLPKLSTSSSVNAEKLGKPKLQELVKKDKKISKLSAVIKSTLQTIPCVKLPPKNTLVGKIQTSSKPQQPSGIRRSILPVPAISKQPSKKTSVGLTKALSQNLNSKHHHVGEILNKLIVSSCIDKPPPVKIYEPNRSDNVNKSHNPNSNVSNSSKLIQKKLTKPVKRLQRTATPCNEKKQLITCPICQSIIHKTGQNDDNNVCLEIETLKDAIQQCKNRIVNSKEKYNTRQVDILEINQVVESEEKELDDREKRLTKLSFIFNEQCCKIKDLESEIKLIINEKTIKGHSVKGIYFPSSDCMSSSTNIQKYEDTWLCHDIQNEIKQLVKEMEEATENNWNPDIYTVKILQIFQKIQDTVDNDDDSNFEPTHNNFQLNSTPAGILISETDMIPCKTKKNECRVYEPEPEPEPEPRGKDSNEKNHNFEAHDRRDRNLLSKSV